MAPPISSQERELLMDDLWWRTFTRSIGPAIDEPAKEHFRNKNFTDFFGLWLQRGDHAKILNFDSLVRKFYDNPTYFKFAIYVVADGGYIPHPGPHDEAISNWFQPHLRYVAVVESANLVDDWVLFIVGGSDVLNGFLQVACWDSSISEYRFYSAEEVECSELRREKVAWIYQGRSADAFGEKTYLGPFNGHVNGAVIMKELDTPWYHWFSGLSPNIGTCLNTAEQAMIESLPYLSGPGVLFSSVSDPDKLQLVVQRGINRWFTKRSANDFPQPCGAVKMETEKVTLRWMAHALLTTTINTSAATQNSIYKELEWLAPVDHFINNMVLHQSEFSGLLPNLPMLCFNYEDYTAAVKKLDIRLIQENPGEEDFPGMARFYASPGTIGGGKRPDGTTHHDQTCFTAVFKGEGLPFVVLQPSYEDARGILEMSTLASNSGDDPMATLPLLEPSTLDALLMLDFCNPVYSWRRGMLLMYVPQQTTWDPSSRKYDLDNKFLEAVRASPQATQEGSPEFQFLALRGRNRDQHRKEVEVYMEKVKVRLLTPDGVLDYMTLAESRRRIFRPLPLNEFGYTLPYAMNYGNIIVQIPGKENQYTLTSVDATTAKQVLPFVNRGPYEMTKEGTIQEIPLQGVKFLEDWTRPLWGDDPSLNPKPTETSRISCSGNKIRGGCPYAVGVKRSVVRVPKTPIKT